MNINFLKKVLPVLNAESTEISKAMDEFKNLSTTLLSIADLYHLYQLPVTERENWLDPGKVDITNLHPTCNNESIRLLTDFETLFIAMCNELTINNPLNLNASTDKYRSWQKVLATLHSAQHLVALYQEDAQSELSAE